MPNDFYLTVAKDSEGFYKEKGSKFLAFAYPVSNEEEIKEKLEALRKQFYDARHFCYGYIFGLAAEHYRANDDGEPNHSAGDPILGQIKSNELTNTLVVVVRYFGGTKLGVGGLITAYKTAAAEALAQNEIIEKPITKSFTLMFPYEEMNEVQRLAKELDLEVVDQTFEMACSMKVNVLLSKVETFESKVQLLQDLSHNIQLK
ncbi:MAG: putative YigZ family protein [Candidatus Endobugula sp.]|jgi:uncharacterized YigZ family protein